MRKNETKVDVRAAYHGDDYDVLSATDATEVEVNRCAKDQHKQCCYRFVNREQQFYSKVNQLLFSAQNFNFEVNEQWPNVIV